MALRIQVPDESAALSLLREKGALLVIARYLGKNKAVCGAIMRQRQKKG